jgi:predicted dehydrogenase
VPTVLTSYDDLLARATSISYDICTPSNLQFRTGEAGPRRGRHALVEKPLAGSLAEVDALTEAERRSQVAGSRRGSSSTCFLQRPAGLPGVKAAGLGG